MPNGKAKPSEVEVTMQNLIVAAVVVVVLAIIIAGFAAMVAKFYRKVDQGKALIVNKMSKDPIVTFTGGLVLPVIHRAEVMDISVKTIEIDRRGKEGLICKDNIRADIKVTFFVRVNKTTEDVLKVAQQVGCARASDQRTLEELFQRQVLRGPQDRRQAARLRGALHQAGRASRTRSSRTIGRDLNGYVLDDAAIDFLEQTPMESLDPHNILDAQGIRKITELTTLQSVQTNDLKQTERKQIKKQNVEAEEAILELERQLCGRRGQAGPRDRDREGARGGRDPEVQAEEHQKAEIARIKAEEEVEVSEEAKNRQIEVAKKNQERVVPSRTSASRRTRPWRQIIRERETELSSGSPRRRSSRSRRRRSRTSSARASRSTRRSPRRRSGSRTSARWPRPSGRRRSRSSHAEAEAQEGW